MNDTTSTHTLTLDTLQGKVFRDKTRHRVVIGGRQLGKSYLAVVELVTAAMRTRNSRCVYLTKTLGQARRTIWESLITAARPWASKINHSDLSIRLVNGSLIRCLGVEVRDALRGLTLDFMVCDEFASWDDGRDVWEAILQPTLMIRRGRSLWVSSPKGYNFGYDLFQRGQSGDPDWKSWRFKTADCPRVSPAELDGYRRTNDPRMFRQEYEASFEAAVGIVYDAFDVNKHVKPSPDNGSKVIVGVDFNVSPISAVVLQPIAPGKFAVIEEIEVWGSTTQEMATRINAKYKGRVQGAPDPTGRFRRSVGVTDVEILEKAGIPCPGWQPIAINDRVNNTQANLLNAAGDISVVIDPKCHKLIKALSSLEWNDSSMPDHKSDLCHITDALGYSLWLANNLMVNPTVVSKLRTH